MEKAPWTDFIGITLFDGDTIIHPSGQSGKIIFKPERERKSDQWVVDYGDGIESRLCLQIGDRGRAIKQLI